MKVTQEKGGFAPITIVLETEEEADYMWHKLNCSRGFSNYAAEYGYTCPYDIPYRMWEKLDNIHKVEENK